MMKGIETIVDMLTWENDTLVDSCVQKATKAHISFLSNQLISIANCEPNDQAFGVLNQLAELDKTTLSYLLKAPETCHHIYLAETNGNKQVWNYLESVMNVELMRKGTMHISTGSKHWSAMGEVEFSQSNKGVTEYFNAPMIEGVVIDLCSPYVKQEIVASNFRPNFGGNSHFSLVEIEKVLDANILAFEGMSYLSIAPKTLVKGVVSTIMPRKDDNNCTFKGSSNRGMIGRINLINPHLKEVDDGVIASSIIHEAIHVYLYLLEEQSLLIEDESFAYDARINSPWSNKLIHPRAYLHASFVWFALFHFWISPKMNERFNASVRDYFISFCLQGFKKGESFNRLIPYRNKFSEPVLDAANDLLVRMKKHGA